MQTLEFELQQAVTLFTEQAQAFLECSQSLSDIELLDSSLCRGWSCLDVIVHVRMGLEEMASSANIHTLSPLTTTLYWTGVEHSDDDPVDRTLWIRRTAASYTRPRKAVEHLNTVIHRATAAVEAMRPGVVSFQSQKLSSGSFVGTWVVELAVHQLDLTAHSEPPGSEWAKKTLETLAGAQLPAQLKSNDSILAAMGRIPRPENVNKPDVYPLTL